MSGHLHDKNQSADVRKGSQFLLTLRDDLLLTQFIICINDDSLHMQLLTWADLTLDTFSTKCFNCGKIGHIAHVCKQINPTQVNEIQLPDDLGTDMIELNTVLSVNHNMMYKCLEVNNSPVRFLVDMGFPVSILPAEWVHTNGVTIQQCNEGLRSYMGHSVEVIGIAECQVVDIKSNTTFVERFYIVQSSKVILGMDLIRKYAFMDVSEINVSPSYVSIHFHHIPNDSYLIFKSLSLPFVKQIKVETKIRQLLKQGILIPEPNPILVAMLH